MTASSFLDELKWRGLLYQTTAVDELVKHLATPGRIAYCGFDPTSDSLTIGNLIQIQLLRHWQRAGHKPIALIGGGTGMIGDPSGKDAERQLMSIEQVQANVEGQRRIFEKLLDFDAKRSNAAVLMNNADWLCKLNFIEVLRDVGKHFSVNTMIQKESVKERLHNREQGISYTEFSYMILQAYDFLHLRRVMNCTVQTAGSDQYGNIVAGIDLIRREFGAGEGGGPAAFGITSPLVKAASGKKIGKTEKGAVWLTADRTSPYAFYQYWINVDDQDVESFLKWFTVMNQDQIADIMRKHEPEPHLRIAQRELARHMTRLIHGETELQRVEAASQALFGGAGDVRGIPSDIIKQITKELPNTTLPRSQVLGHPYADVLPASGVTGSKREAREFLAQHAISPSGLAPLSDASAVVEPEHLLNNDTLLIKKGKRSWFAITLTEL